MPDPILNTDVPSLTTEQENAGRQAAEQLAPRYKALIKVQPRRASAAAGVVALATASKVTDAKHRPLFEQLPSERFRKESLLELSSAALAYLYCTRELANADAVYTEARVPVGTAREAGIVKDRMWRVLSYHLSGDEDATKVLADIRSGQGYLDLANDLLRLAPMYAAHHGIVSRDPTLYVSTDEAQAEKLGNEILTALGAHLTEKQRAQQDLANRAWTFLNETYEHIAVPGRWLFPEEASELFPSLVQAGRRRAVRKQTTPAPTPG